MPSNNNNTHRDEENPLMALVDAASILELQVPARIEEGPSEVEDVSDMSSGSDSISECDSSSRPSTPPVSKAPLVPAVSPMSVASSCRTRSIEESLLAAGAVSSSSPNNNNKKLTFADQLMVALDDDELSDILTWMPDGKAFTIVDPKRFTKEHMPGLFNIRNMSSFVRKLTRWGFARFHDKETLNSDIFFHPEFQRGNPDMCRDIKCGGRSSTPPTTTLPPSRSTATIISPSVLAMAKQRTTAVVPENVMRPRSLPTAMDSSLSTRRNSEAPLLHPTLALQRFLVLEQHRSYYRHHLPAVPAAWAGRYHHWTTAGAGYHHNPPRSTSTMGPY